MHINEISEGRYKISSGISKSELIELAENPNSSIIQLSNPLREIEINYLEEFVFSKRPDIMLRIYAHYNNECNLSFIENIPSLRKFSADCLTEAKGIESVIKLKNLEMLSVGIYLLDSFEFLNEINPSLKSLYLYSTKSKKTKIHSISRFTELEELYLERQENGIEEISKLKKLKEIVLRSISTNNIDFLTGLNNLWSVDVKLGGIKSFNSLEKLSNLKYLELWQIRGLSDLSFISNIVSLQNLHIQSLSYVEKFPNLEKLINLRRISIENIKGLNNFESLRHLPSLEDFILTDGSSQKLESLIPVLENPNVNDVSCYFGSLKKNIQFAEMVSQYGKKEYERKKFIYK